ncbi:MAG: 2-isopropylmalate synthase [Candidatus Bathyarchaeota archaeon]|nr:2-isopropylmalate synthase [Candidatus Termiticorpusculum sp.]MCL2868221.1 2-isopropylmalate synthase [Candidatus Termiticorpusculum sp.]
MINTPRNIKILDTTLRDGEQTPGVSLTIEDKIEIAQQLNNLGVDIIEAGFPSSSEGERKVVKEIKQLGLTSQICALSRCTKNDIDAALDCNVDLIHIFIPTSPVQMKHAVNMTPEQVLSSAVESIQYIKKHGVKCEFSPMDATRTETSFLHKICKAAQDAGMDSLNVPDTVGCMIPKTTFELFKDLKAIIKVPISVHCHDDFGLAVANSLAAVEAGADQVHVAVNGLGERAGNAALEEVITTLHVVYGYKTNINTRLLYRTSRLVSSLSGVSVQVNKAIVGENAFAHESGIHTRGVTEQPLTFEPISPELVGRTRKLVAGKLAGTRGIQAELNEISIHPNDVQLAEIVQRVKELGDKGKSVTDADLISLTSAVMGQVIGDEKIVDLCDLAVVTGIRVLPTASVRLTLDGKEYVAAETGVGPVDAVLKAIQKLTGNLEKIKLSEYRLEAITGGSNAVAEVVVKVEDEKGNIVSARATREDIVMASVEAMLNGINKCLLKNRSQGKKQ